MQFEAQLRGDDGCNFTQWMVWIERKQCDKLLSGCDEVDAAIQHSKQNLSNITPTVAGLCRTALI